MKSITTTGLDIAKDVFQVHCAAVDQSVVVSRALKRRDVLTFFAKQPPHLAVVGDATNGKVPLRARIALRSLVHLLGGLDAEIAALDVEIRAAHTANPTSRRLECIPSVGPLTAHAAATTVADPRAYRSGRDFAASLGLTPKLDGTGGKVTLGSISKKGDRYLRRRLYLGAVSQCAAALRWPEKADPWLLRLLNNKPFKVAAIALANKTARIIWKLLVSGETYVPKPHTAAQAAAA